MEWEEWVKKESEKQKQKRTPLVGDGKLGRRQQEERMSELRRLGVGRSSGSH